MFNVGSAVAVLKADITNFKQGMQEAQAESSNLGNTLSKASENIVSFGKQAAVFTGVVAAGFALVAKNALSSAAEFEQNRIAFETMLGSADKARSLLKDISDFAMKTPFELPQLVEGSKKLLAYNVAAEDIIPTMKVLGDITSGVGVDKMPQLILAFGQVKAATKLTGNELRQFSEAGVPLLDALAKNAKKSAAEMITAISDGEVKFEDVQKALAGMTAEGGKFFQGMERQSKTFNGTVSNIKDQVGRLLRAVMGINEAGDIAAGSLFQKIADSANKLLTILTQATPQIISAIDGIVTKISDFTSSLQPLIDWIMANQEMVLTFLTGLAIGIGALVVIGTITALMTAFLSPLTLVVFAIGVLYTAWQTNFWGIRDITAGVFNEMKIIWENILLPTITAIITSVTAAWENISAVTTVIWPVIWGTIQVIWALIYGLISVGLALMTGDWKQAWENVLHASRIGWEGLKDIFWGVVGMVKTWGGEMLHWMVQPFVDAWNQIQELVRKIKDAMDPNKRHSPSMVDRVKAGVQDLNKAWGDLSVPMPTYSHAPEMNFAGASMSGGSGPISITIPMAGAFIGDELSAQRMSEVIGNNIIKKLQANIRF